MSLPKKSGGLKGYFQKQTDRRRQNAAGTTPPGRMRHMLLDERSSFAATEAYKAMRTNLLFTRVGDGCQRLAFTSTFESEGKTVNCCNVALTLAQNGQKVLIIDADMRRPMVHNVFGIPNESGLSEVLARLSGFVGSTGQSRSPFVATRYPNLSVLPSGHVPPNPAELLASDQMRHLLDVMSQHFDYIFIDLPPVAVVTDAAVLAQSVQGYVLVVRAGVTPLESLRGVVLKLEQLGGNILGFLLNDLDAKSGSYKYTGYNSGRYRKYGDGYRNSSGYCAVAEATAESAPPAAAQGKAPDEAD